jgi:hypothetical protein
VKSENIEGIAKIYESCHIKMPDELTMVGLTKKIMRGKDVSCTL